MEPHLSSSRPPFTGAQPTWIALIKYLIGEATSTERSDVERWSTSSPDRQATLPMLRTWWAKRPPESADTDQTAIDQIESALSVVLQRASLSIPTNAWLDSSPADTRAQENKSGIHAFTKVIRTLFGELTNHAAALIDGKDTALKAEDIDRLRALVQQTEPEDE